MASRRCSSDAEVRNLQRTTCRIIFLLLFPPANGISGGHKAPAVAAKKNPPLLFLYADHSFVIIECTNVR